MCESRELPIWTCRKETMDGLPAIAKWPHQCEREFDHLGPHRCWCGLTFGANGFIRHWERPRGIPFGMATGGPRHKCP
jgi:hypothetical protein